MIQADELLLIGATMGLLLAVTGFVLTQRGAWQSIFVLAALFGGMNIGVFLWSEILEGWNSFRLFLFWLTALLPPLAGLAIGALLGYLVNWRIARIRSSRK